MGVAAVQRSPDYTPVLDAERRRIAAELDVCAAGLFRVEAFNGRSCLTSFGVARRQPTLAFVALTIQGKYLRQFYLSNEPK